MNFEFTEEQNILREQARKFLNQHCAPRRVRAVLEGDTTQVLDLWRRVTTELGWAAVVVPKEFGGLGLSYIELCVIAEELGRAVAPIPFSSSIYLASEAVLLAGNLDQKNRWLPRLASGEAIGTLAYTERGGQTLPRNLITRMDGDKLSGAKVPVPDGDIADMAIVLAAHAGGDGASLYIVELNQGAVTRTSIRMIDPTRSHAELKLNNVKAELLGAAGEGWSLLQAVLDRAAVLFAWEQLGGAEAALEQAREYALGRYAFGRPIGSYQGIKHKLAHMYVKNTLARSNCYFASWALNTNASELSVGAATARVAAIQAYHFASKENIHTHGGAGFTWEFDCQFYYRRAKLLSVNIGSERLWQDKLISAIECTRVA